MPIPHVFHRMWFGGDPPEEARKFGDEWARLHSGWVMVEWNEDTLPVLENQGVFDQAEELAPGFAGQLRADVARYEILWRYGGVYIDCDFEPLRSIEALIDDAEAFAAWERDDVWINNAILGFPAGHPFLRRLIDGLATNVARARGRRPNVMTGPQYLTRLWREDPNGVVVYRSELFYPYAYNELDRRGEVFPNAFAVHHWNNQRRIRA